MNQNNSNSNQQSNSDLDSLLKEFQMLSEIPQEPVKPVEPVLQSNMVNKPVTNPVGNQTVDPFVNPTPTYQQAEVSGMSVDPVLASAQQRPIDQARVTSMNNAGINNPTAAPQPVMPTPTQDIPVVSNAPVPPVKPASSIDDDVIVNPGLNVNLNTSDGGIIPKADQNIANNSDATTSLGTSLQKNKGSDIFIIVLFLVIGLFILFIPKVSDFFSNKPGKESKPTATPIATPTPTPLPVVKEKKMVCTTPEVVVTDTNKVQTIYHYYYKDNKVTKVEKVFQNIYTTVDDTNQLSYNSTKNICDTLAAKYTGITGYVATCEEKNNIFTVTNVYDLQNFVNPTEIIVGTTTEKIESPVDYGEKIESAKEKMEAQGATCK